jgi:hypothetical protein
VGVVGGGCAWESGEVAAWDGPYLDATNVNDFWKTSYCYDPDYAFCVSAVYPQVLTCPTDSSVTKLCIDACKGAFNCSPPVIQSYGQDKMPYTCDDIVVKMTLN